MSGSGGGINTYNDYSNRPTVRDGVAVDGVKDVCDLYSKSCIIMNTT